MQNERNFGDTYPSSLPSTFSSSSNVALTFGSGNGKTYCIDAVSRKVASVKYFLSTNANGEANEPRKGTCATGETLTGTIAAGWGQLSAGLGHSCMVINSRAYCVGQNPYGEIGDGTKTTRTTLTAVNVSGELSGKKVSMIGVGTDHSCALAEGKLYCWGRNSFGQLGNGTTTDSSVPTEVNMSGALSGKTVTAIAPGTYHTCVLAGGDPYCWGYNSSGQIGNGSTQDALEPVAVNTSGVLAGLAETSISAGGAHTCVVASAKAFCWGSGSSGRLGNGSSTNKTTPVAVTATSGPLLGKTVTSISAGEAHTCAVASGAAYCWGYNVNGQVGDNSVTARTTPVAVDVTGVLAGKTVTAIGASGYNRHSCAVASGALYCWGINTYGQLGDNTTTQSLVPVAVVATGALSGKTPTIIESGGHVNCTVISAEMYCWGYGGYGQLAKGSTTNSGVPIKAIAP
jgi:alpha-tubulin suppressor-like RCC1 family protein